MGNWHREKEYHCDGCDWDGCSVLHTAKLTYWGASDVFQFEDGKGNEMYFDRNTLKSFIELSKDPVFFID